MSFVGNNPKFTSVVLDGYLDFTAANASVKKEGRLVYVRSTDAFYKDNGSTLIEIDPSTLVGKSIVDPERLDVKKDILANLMTYASTATNGQLVFATDTKELYQVVDSALASVGGGGGLTDYWQKVLSADLSADGVIGDLAISGLTIGKKYKVTVNVKCARVTTAENEIQTITFSSVPNWGSWKINFDGQVTDILGYNVTALDVENALIALSNIDASGVSVSGDFSTGFVVEFINTEGATNQPEMTIVNNTLESGATGGVNEVQDLTFSAAPTGGTFTITFDGQTTAAIAYNATPAQVKAALEALNNIDVVTVTAI